MATLQVRGLDDKLYTELKRLAKDENRSLNQEVIVLLKKSIAPAQSRISPREATRELLKLRWEDSRSAAEILNYPLYYIHSSSLDCKAGISR